MSSAWYGASAASKGNKSPMLGAETWRAVHKHWDSFAAAIRPHTEMLLAVFASLLLLSYVLAKLDAHLERRAEKALQALETKRR